MRKIVLLLFFSVALAIVAKAQEIFSFDFSGDPTGNFIVYDWDKNTPSPQMQQIGFKVGTPWYPIRESASSANVFYGSTSSYIPAGQADDWLVTKGLEIPTGGCVLEWKSQAYDPKKRDGLKIFISTKGQAVEDFPETPLWEVEEEEAGSADPDKIEGEWVEHTLSLNEYAGKTVYIAFVNQSYDKSLILLDDIWVGRRSDYDLSLTTEEYVDVPEATVTGEFSVLGDVTVAAYTVHYSCADGEFTQAYSGLNLKRGDTHVFAFDRKIPLEQSKTVKYQVWMEVNGETTLKQNGSVTQVAYFPKRTVVIEEGTGTWCGNCVLGLWAMEYLRENYSDDGFIGIGVHNGDKMTDKEYDRALGLTTFPMGVVNRKVSCSPVTNDYQLQTSGAEPETFVDHFLKAREERTFAEIEVKGSYNSDSTQIDALATVKSVITVDGVDYRVAFVVIENGVTGYVQLNYFSGTTYPIGGYEKLPKNCSLAFDDVARGIWPTFSGDAGSLPSSLTAGEPVEYAYSIPIPATVKNKQYLELIALLLNGQTSEIMNAHRFPMTEYAHDRIDNSLRKGLNLLVSDGRLTVTDDSGSMIHAELFDVTGKKISGASATGIVRLPANGYKGIAILRVNGEARKVIF